MQDVIESIVIGQAGTVWLSLMVPIVIKSALILGAAAIITHLLRGSAAALRHLVWLTAMVGVLLLPVLSVLVPTIRVPISAPHAVAALPPMTSAGGIYADAPAAPAPIAPSPVAPSPVAPSPVAPSPVAPSPVASSPVAPSPAASSPVAPAPIAAPTVAAPIAGAPSAAAPDANPPTGIPTILANLADIHWATWLFVIWVGVTVLLLARLVFAHAAAWLLVRDARRVDDDDWHLRLERHALTFGIDRRVKLRECDWLDVPVTVGTIFPVVVLPQESQDWDDATRDAVLLHELAHIRRFDCLGQTIVEFVRAVLWVNPLTWYAESAMRTERERACDDLVITNGTRASSYAQTLLALARSLRGKDLASAAVMAMARRSDLEGRLLDILDGAPRLRTVNRVGATLAVMIVLSVIVPVAALSPAMAQDARNDKTTDPVLVDPDLDFDIDFDFNHDFDHEFDHEFDHDFDYDYDYDFEYDYDYDYDYEFDYEYEYDYDFDYEFDFEADFPGDDLGRNLEKELRELERDMRHLDLELERDLRDLKRDLDRDLGDAKVDVDAGFVADLIEAGYHDISADDMIVLAKHDLEVDCIEELNGAGYGKLPIDTIVKFTRYDVDADFIRSFAEAGIRDLSVDDLIDLRKHDVGVDEVKRMRAKNR